MNNRNSIKAWSPDSRKVYDVALVALGYETRATYAVRELGVQADRCVALAFTSSRAHAYVQNEITFGGLGFEVVGCADPLCYQVLRNLLVVEGKSSVSMFVDVSSFNRVRLAQIIQVLWEASENQSVEVDFVYTVGRAGDIHDHGPIKKIGPVTPFFAGWSSSADVPPAAIFGVGYEQEKAIGCLENLEAFTSWAFRTADDGSENYQLVTEANDLLWQTVPEERIVEYMLDEPLGTFISLEAVVYGALQMYRPVLIPFGPKIFYLCNLLVATIHRPAVAVWRAELVRPEPPQDRFPDRILGLSATFRPDTAGFCPPTPS